MTCFWKRLGLIPVQFTYWPFGDFSRVYVIVLADSDLMLLFIVTRPSFFDRQAHLKRTLWDQYQLDPNAIGDRFGGLCVNLTTQLNHPKHRYG